MARFTNKEAFSKEGQLKMDFRAMERARRRKIRTVSRQLAGVRRQLRNASSRALEEAEFWRIKTLQALTRHSDEKSLLMQKLESKHSAAARCAVMTEEE